MNAIFSYVNQRKEYADITITLSLYENRVEIDCYQVDPNGVVFTSQEIWRIKNIVKLEFYKGPKDVCIKMNDKDALRLPTTADATENLEKFVKLLKERL